MLALIRFQPKLDFKKELKIIKEKQRLPKRSWIVPLCPFIDKSDLLCVGGRLGNAHISEKQKHPILLRKGHFVDLYLRHLHLDNGHAGNSLMERLTKENFWIPSIGTRIKKCIRECITCTRWKAQTIHQQMSDLPDQRVEPSPCFGYVGVDSAGPFNIKASRIKFEKVIKVWFAVFVCMFTKAVHLEIVTDLSTENFMAAFQRFCARRGTPQSSVIEVLIFSD